MPILSINQSYWRLILLKENKYQPFLILQSNWGYNRYNAYYNYYGENAPETKQAEADSKN